MPSPSVTIPWECPIPTLPYDADGLSMESRSSAVCRVIRRIGLSSSSGETSTHSRDYNARSLGGVDKKAPSLVSKLTAFGPNRPESPIKACVLQASSMISSDASSRFSRRQGRRTRTEKNERLEGVADMLEDDDLAWGPPPSKRFNRKNSVAMSVDN
ncbi:hypothetical protein BN946_scf184829.g13 [Trametes cinnabarina]|uniref:Uncharacterized protein n=1 Tax=Pycnoporus cinnabarinus TaxID=5643 RepID=A0A060S980_PYCCI|nr:hypothetical protein BN946_scf184829.g13 [Trametes cinnabarina]